MTAVAESGVALAVRPILDGMADLEQVNPISVLAGAVLDLDSRSMAAAYPGGVEKQVGNLAIASNDMRRTLVEHGERIDFLGRTVVDHGTRVSNLETAVAGLSGKVGGLETKVGSLETKVGSLETKLDDLSVRVDSLERKMDIGFDKITKLIEGVAEDLGRRIGDAESRGASRRNNRR